MQLHISASIVMCLIITGRARIAGVILVIVQTAIVLVASNLRSPEMALTTVIYFGFPTLLLAVVFSKTWTHISVSLFLTAGLIFNYLRFDMETVTASPEAIGEIVTRGTIMCTGALLLLYAVSIVTVRSLNISLIMSRKETEKSNEKNLKIMELVDAIRKSYNELKESISTTDTAIADIFLNIQTEAATIEELVASIEEISSSTDSVVQATKDQNDSVNELSGSINSLSEIIDNLGLFGKDLQQEFISIAEMSSNGKVSSGELNEVNKRTLLNSDNMQTIAEIIDDFFDKINLLSLNASIEAARAGEHGRGFAVVADEIGKLADNSSSELKKIKDLIDVGRSDVEFSRSIIEKIVLMIGELSDNLHRVQTKATDTMKIISDQKDIQGDMIYRNRKVHERSEFIKDASSEQAIAIQEIEKSIENTNDLVQKNTRSAESLHTSYESLKGIADELKQIIDEKH